MTNDPNAQLSTATVKAFVDGLSEELKTKLTEVAGLVKEVQGEVAKDRDRNTDEIERLSREIADKTEAVRADLETRVGRFNMPHAEELLQARNPDQRWMMSRFLINVKSGRDVEDWPDGPEKEMQVAYYDHLAGHNDPEVRALVAGGRLNSSVWKAMATTPAEDGGHWVPNNVLWDRLIPAVQANSAVMKAGITVLPGLSGTVDIPKLTDVVTAYMIGENEPPTESQLKTGTLSLNQHDIGALLIVSNRLLAQSAVAVDTIARGRLGRTLGLKLDEQCLIGTGNDKQMVGILEHPNIGEVDFSGFGMTTAGSGSTFYELLVDAQDSLPIQDLGDDAEDAIGWSPAWIFSPSAFRSMRKLKSANTGADHHEFQRILLTEGRIRMLLGDPFFRTSLLTATTGGTPSVARSHGVYGNWAEFFLGQFTPLAIAVSTEYRFSQRQTAFLATIGADCGAAHELSFTKMKSIPHA